MVGGKAAPKDGGKKPEGGKPKEAKGGKKGGKKYPPPTPVNKDMVTFQGSDLLANIVNNHVTLIVINVYVYFYVYWLV